MQTPIYFDARWSGTHGIGRFSAELEKRLPNVVPLSIAGAKLSLIDPLASTLALARRRPGVFFTPGFNAPLASAIPFAFTIHDLIHLQVPSESSPLRRLYYASVVKPATRKAARILTVSDYSRDAILEWSGIPARNVVVVGNGVSEAFSPGTCNRKGRRYFLHVGRRVSHKNIGRLLAALAAVRRTHDIQLVFTGNADAATVALARSFGVEESAVFAGAVSDSTLADLYRGAEALVFPSLHEGFGLPIVEAMACGTPVITSNLSSMAEVAGAGNALLINPEEIDSIRDGMDRVLTDNFLREKLRKAGLERARAFRWRAVAERVQQALHF